jgi:AmmeMemoRadiSam system protein B
LAKDHSIEVQLPLIKYCSKNKNTRIVPMTIPHYIDLETIDKLSVKIAKIIKKSNKDIVCLAVGNMSHVEIRNEDDLNKYKRLDQDFINFFKVFDIKGFYSNFSKQTGAGLNSITLLMLISKKLGATQSKFLKYYTNCDLFGLGHYLAAYFSGVLIKNNHEISNNT